MRELPVLMGGAERDEQLWQALEKAHPGVATPEQRILIVLAHWAVFQPAMGKITGKAEKLLLRELAHAIAPGDTIHPES